MSLAVGCHIPPIRPSCIYTLQHPEKYLGTRCNRDHCRWESWLTASLGKWGKTNRTCVLTKPTSLLMQGAQLPWQLLCLGGW